MQLNPISCFHLAAAALALAQPLCAKEWRVFLLAGQSNMEGVGVAAEAPANLLAQPAVRLYHSPTVHSALPANQWNPLKPAGISATNFGPELAFAYRVAEAFPSESIALIKHAKGGTKLTTEPLDYEVTSWHPGTNAADAASFGTEFATFVRTVTNALAALRAQGDTPVLSGMLWVQGEADATLAATGTAYEQNLTRFIRRVREQFAAPDLPFVCAQILPYQTRPGSVAVRQALADIDQDSGSPAAQPHAFVIRTEGLGVNTDSVHFNTPGQLGLGALLADSMVHRGLGHASPPPPQTLAYWQLDEPSNAPYLLDAAGVFHLDKQVASAAAPALVAGVAQADSPLFLDGSNPHSNAGGLANCRGVRRLYDETLDMRAQPWTFEAFFNNRAAGTQTVYEVIGGTRSALSGYKGWNVIMINGKIRFFATANSGQTAYVLSAARFDDRQTHHLAAVWDPSTGTSGKMRLYLDGALAGEAAGIGDLGDASTYTKLFAIGGTVSGTAAAPVITDNTWNGTLDEVRLTRGALQPKSFLTAIPKGTVLRMSRGATLARRQRLAKLDVLGPAFEKHIDISKKHVF
jgi:iduronate 2-sulfatase